jgi:hypothetical protein
MKISLLAFAGYIAPSFAVAPIIGTKSDKAVGNSFIVVLKQGISASAFESHLASTNSLLVGPDAVRKSIFELEGLRGYHLKASRFVVEQLAEIDDVRTWLNSL